MNKIKGLVIKDLLQLKTYKKNYIYSIIIYAIIIGTNMKSFGSTFIGASMIMFLFSVYAMATFNYDEKSKSDRYILTLPVTKKDVIIAKYVLSILSLFVGLLIGIILNIVLFKLILNKMPDFNTAFVTILGSVFALSIMQSIQIPCIYKYGAEKGRLQIYIIMMFIVLLIVLFQSISNFDLSFLSKIDKFIPFIIIILTILNYYVSYKISYKIYLKKEV